MGIVYDVEHRSMQRPAALKVLKLTGPKAAVMAEKMLDEARMLGRLDHPNLIEVFDACDAGGDEFGHWMVMEKLEGRELSQVIRDEGPLGLERALHYAEQIASAAACAHGVDVVHRDLKPDNIHVSPKEVVKVIDFGASRFRSGATLNMVVGTVPYMSPEQMRKVDTLDGRSDLFALGLILHEMVTGKHVYRDASGSWIENGRVFHATLSTEPLSFGYIDPRVQPLIERATAKDRDQRYPSMEAFAADIAALRKTVSSKYAPTERFSVEAVVDAGSSATTAPMTSTEAAALTRTTSDATYQRSTAVPGHYLVLAALAALVVGLGVVLLATAPQDSAQANVNAASSPTFSAAPVPVRSASVPHSADASKPPNGGATALPTVHPSSVNATAEPSIKAATTPQVAKPVPVPTFRPPLPNHDRVQAADREVTTSHGETTFQARTFGALAVSERPTWQHCLSANASRDGCAHRARH